jgi:hypothetical protein
MAEMCVAKILIETVNDDNDAMGQIVTKDPLGTDPTRNWCVIAKLRSVESLDFLICRAPING